jgi:hypothetical protein
VNKWIIFAIVIITLLTLLGVVRYLNNKSVEYYSQYWESFSLDEAKKNDVFIKEVKIIPNQIQRDEKIIKFKNCWIEEQTQIIYKFLFVKTRKYLGRYNLCFTLQNPKSDNIWKDYFFVRDDLGRSFGCRSSVGDKGEYKYVFYDHIDKIESRSFKVSILKSWKEERVKNITFVIK